MLVFPQLGSGAIAQFPFVVTRDFRTVTNSLSNGQRYVYADDFAGTMRWQLSYDALTDAESSALLALFSACEGRRNSFLFVDPSANALAFSEDLSQPVWQTNGPLGIASVADPFGGTRAFRLTNATGAALTLSQTASIPGSMTATFSVFARLGYNGTNLSRTDGSNVKSASIAPGSSWRRQSCSSTFASSLGEQSTFQISIPAGAVLEVFGPQVDAQASAATYRTSVSSGIYLNARFDQDEFQIKRTGPGLSSVSVMVITRV